MNGDISIRYKGKDYTFYLAKDPQTNQKMWKVSSTKILPPIYSADENPRSSKMPQEVLDVREQSYFYKGFGQENLDDLYRYYTAGGTDARRKGAVLLGGKYAASTINANVVVTAPSITNSGFETGDTTGWTVSAGSLTASDVDKHDGTYGARNRENEAQTFYQDLTWSNDYRNHYFTVTCWVNPNNAATLVLTVDDGIGTTTASSTAAGWTQLTVTRKLDAAATRLRIQGSHAAAMDFGTYVYWDTFTCTAAYTTDYPVSAFCDYGGYHYAALGYYLVKWDGTDWKFVQHFPYLITDLCIWGSYLFIAMGYANNWYYYDGTTMTLGTVANGKAQYIGANGGTMWFNSSAYEVRSSTNPINGGSVSVVTEIVSTNTIITDVVISPTMTVIAAQDGFYEIDAAGDVLELVPELKQEKSAYTGLNSIVWKGKLYVATGLSSLYEYDLSGSVITNVSPASSAAPGLSDFTGRVCAMYGDSEYLYMVIDNDTGIEVVAGHWTTVNGDTGFFYHHVGSIATFNAASCLLSSYSSVKRLWIGASDDGAIEYLHVPTQYGDVSADTNYQMLTSGDFYTSWIRGAYPYNIKNYYSLTIYGSNLSATKYFTVYYRKDGETAWTTLGTITSSTDNTLQFPAAVTTRRLQLKLSFTSDSATSSPEFEGYTMRMTVWPFSDQEGLITLNEEGEFLSYGGPFTNWTHNEYRYTMKNFYYIAVTSEGLTDSKYITVQYMVDDDDDYTTLETLVTESPVQKIYFPDNTTGYELKVRFDISSTSDTQLLSYSIGGILRPTPRKQVDMLLLVADNVTTRTGTMIRQSAKESAKILREIETYEWPVTLTTWDGQQYDVVFKDVVEELLTDDPLNHPEYRFKIKALQTNL